MSVFYILIKRMLMLKMIKRKITREKNQHAAESKTKGIRSSDVGRAVVQKEASEVLD